MVLLLHQCLSAIDLHQMAQTKSLGLLMYFVGEERCSGLWWVFGGDLGVLFGFVVCLFVFLRAILRKSKKLLLKVRRKRSGLQNDPGRKPNTSLLVATDNVTLGALGQHNQNFSPNQAALL